ncbi:MAG TPA: alpha-L-fucosidase, partial [Chitinophagaceae bacterium]
HAFDWEHPDAPGNDWEYKNPGGDLNLFGGRDWYDLHPDLLEKAKKYVDEKAIPQIRELLTKYHPDILWFDTPHKLPLSENIRILKAIREVDSNVVVNGRLVRFSNENFGDYKNTADRPAEFFPTTGDWEAIPTTNESYGYSKFDNSHKPVAHFIRLLATAASKGGNLLMNIGPMGDGAFDKKDLLILDGIGNWLKKNGQSIYGTKAAPLPYHSWGVSTVKGNKIYLHVFNWPADGKLYVSSAVQISNGYFLSDPTKKVNVTKTKDGDNLLILPKSAPDSINTVLVFDWKEANKKDVSHLVVPNTKLERFLSFDAMQSGKGFGYGDGKTDRYYTEGWKSKEQYLYWPFRSIASPGQQFKVIIKYLAPAESSGGEYAVIIEDDAKELFKTVQTVTTDPKSSTVITKEIGTVSLKQGKQNLKIVAQSIAKTELMKLLEIQLIPIDKQ